MKIVRYSAEGEVRCGIAEEDGTIRALAGSPFDSLDAGEEVAQLDQVQVLAPVAMPRIIGVGLNYAAHAAEGGKEPPADPMLFMLPSTAVGGIHLTGVTICSVHGVSSRWQALPGLGWRVSSVVSNRCGLPGLPRMAAVARWLRLSELRPRRRLALGRWPLHVSGVFDTQFR